MVVEPIEGDVLTKDEMKQRGIVMMPSTRGGAEFRTTESLTTIARHMIEAGFIDEYHYSDASVFLDLRRAYEAGFGIKWCKASGQPQLGSGDASEAFDAIRHHMGIKRAALVSGMIQDAMQTHYKNLPAIALEKYKDAFEDVSKAMLEARNAKKDVV